MSSLELEQKEDDQSKFGTLNVTEGNGVKDRDEQDGGYFDAMMDHNTEESSESIDSFIKKTVKENEDEESEIKHTELKDFVDDAHIYGSEDDSSYNLDEELEKESQVVDCESTDLELNDLSLGLSLQDTSEGEGDDLMGSEETDDMLSDKIAGDEMDSDDENDLIKTKGDVTTSEEQKGTEGKDLFVDDDDDDMVATESGKVVAMHAKRGKGGEGKRKAEGADMESTTSGVGESSGLLLDTKYVGRKKDLFVKKSNVKVMVHALDKKVGEARDQLVSGSLSGAENLKQDEKKKEKALVKTSQVHVKVDVTDKIVCAEHSDDKDKIPRSGDKRIGNIGKSKESTVILRDETENIDLKNKKIQGSATENHENIKKNLGTEDMSALKDQKHSKKCIKSENCEEATESISKMRGKKKEFMEGTPSISTCDGQPNKVTKDVMKESKMKDTLKKQVNAVECKDEVRKHKSKTTEEGKRDRDAEESEITETRVKLTKTDESRNVAQTNKDDKVQKEALKKRDEKLRIMRRNQKRHLEGDHCEDLGSLKKTSRTHIKNGDEDDTDEDACDISDTCQIVSTGQKTVSNIERLKRKIEEIMETSKDEEDAFVEEIETMKQEKADLLDKISSEMKKLKTLVGSKEQEK